MLRKNCLFTSESVTEGHPDKVADQISDAVLDAALTQDKLSRVACETLVTNGLVVVSGEMTTKAYVDVADLVRGVLKDIGYNGQGGIFDGKTCGILSSIQRQSPDISMGVDTGGAGDQGMMFGYACDETPELMPLAITLAHRITRALSESRKSGVIDYLRPDGKSQVTVEYRDGKPVAVRTVVVSAHHATDVVMGDMRAEIETLVRNQIPQELSGEMKILVNPTGRFEVGGPQADTGLTGRKIICDTYGGAANHGGGAFSGKDPSKVDRSAAYVARRIAKSVVASGAASKCEIQIAYAIGVAEPVSVAIETYGTETVPIGDIEKAVHKAFDLTPKGIITSLDLLRPIYQKTAAFGHFGRNEPEFTWEVPVVLSC
jgi:S-adenosylmethionine synthetase